MSWQDAPLTLNEVEERIKELEGRVVPTPKNHGQKMDRHELSLLRAFRSTLKASLVEVRNDTPEPLWFSACRTKIGAITGMNIIYVHLSDSKESNPHPDRANFAYVGEYGQVHIGVETA